MIEWSLNSKFIATKYELCLIMYLFEKLQL